MQFNPEMYANIHYMANIYAFFKTLKFYKFGGEKGIGTWWHAYPSATAGRLEQYAMYLTYERQLNLPNMHLRHEICTIYKSNNESAYATDKPNMQIGKYFGY